MHHIPGGSPPQFRAMHHILLTLPLDPGTHLVFQSNAPCPEYATLDPRAMHHVQVSPYTSNATSRSRGQSPVGQSIAPHPRLRPSLLTLPLDPGAVPRRSEQCTTSRGYARTHWTLPPDPGGQSPADQSNAPYPWLRPSLLTLHLDPRGAVPHSSEQCITSWAQPIHF